MNKKFTNRDAYRIAEQIGYKKALAEVEEIIDGLNCLSPLHKSFPKPCKTHNKIIDADDLKQDLQKLKEEGK